MIHPTLIEAFAAARREGHARPIRFAEKQLRAVGYVLSAEDEALLDNFNGNGGRKPKRDSDGRNPTHVLLANAFELYQRFTTGEGMRDSEARVRVCRELTIRANVMDAVIARRRSAVNQLLRERGVLGK